MTVSRGVLQLARPLHTAYGTVREREILTLGLADDDGMVGYGDAAPLESYDGIGVQRTMAALERYRPVLESLDGTDPREITSACRRVDELPAALSAVNLALWDKVGRRQNRPVSKLILADAASEVAVNAVISATDPAAAAEQATAFAAQGFQCLKVKVGIGEDIARVRAVREAAGPEVALRLDANGAWDVEQAVRAIDALAPMDLELVEEPTHGLRAVSEVRERVAVPIAIDETAAEPGALDAGAADAICLKISRHSGIHGLIEAVKRADKADTSFYFGSSLDGPLAVAGCIHLAAVLTSQQSLPACGLATLGLFEGLEDMIPVRDGRIVVPTRPGLGVEPGWS